MRGVVRPCRTHLGPALHAQWQAHLCGLCLTLRAEAGQPERALTGYDVLLLSVLVEAQAGALPTSQAGPCPLRAFRPATVVAASEPAVQFAAAGALLTGAAGLDDKLGDGEVWRPARRSAGSAAARLGRTGRALAVRSGFDPAPVAGAPAAARRAEGQPGDLADLLAPAGEAVAALFAHTAVLAGTPGNAPHLRRCGDAFGRLVHLLDAVEDHADDAGRGRFNPLAATATHVEQAHCLARELAAEVEAALAACVLVDPALVSVLLGREVRAAVARAFPVAEAVADPGVPAQRAAGASSLVALWAVLANAVIIGGWSSGGGGCGPRRRRRRYDEDPYGRTYVSAPRGGLCCGPGCGQLLACNCCANLACNACCCGSDCADA